MKQTITHLLEDTLRPAFTQCGVPEDMPLLLTEASKAEFGDYQLNGVMKAAKQLGKNPRQLASDIIAAINPQDMIAKLDIAGPGFINIILSNDFLAKFVQRLDATNNYGVNYLNHLPQTVVIDYSSPNLAKEMHVGHLRSTVIGDALVRILSYLGDNVLRQNHVGDWGTQFGMLIAYLQELKTQTTSSSELSDLEEFYRKAKARYDSDEGFQHLARHCVVILQNWQEHGLDGEKVYNYWLEFTRISLAHCAHIYKKLGVLLTDADIAPESMYNKDLNAVIDKLDTAGMLTISDGAKCVFLDNSNQSVSNVDTPFIVQKKDGGFLYATTDLAALNYRCHVLGAKRIIYVVDARQSLHFKQLFHIASQAGFATADTVLQHVEFGTMMAEDGKPFKTRSGGTVKLIDLIDEAQLRALQVINTKSSSQEISVPQELANTLAIGAIKYADLSKNRSSDYIFSFDKMLAFDGNTAPYLLYAYTRIQSLLARARTQLGDNLDNYLNAPIVLQQDIEHKLALALAKFADTLAVVASECLPHYLCQYLYNLSSIFMQFYESCAILKETDGQLLASRLVLVTKVSQILATGLNLLGITTVNKM